MKDRKTTRKTKNTTKENENSTYTVDLDSVCITTEVSQSQVRTLSVNFYGINEDNVKLSLFRVKFASEFLTHNILFFEGRRKETQ